MDSKEQKNSIQLKYGDIIEISSPSNEEYHQNNFYITYVDDDILEIVNTSSMKKHSLNIKMNKLTDESIIAIFLLNRSEVSGYARQNNLNTHTWLDIYIGGDTPVIFTGEITNLEEDMIEVTTFPEGDVIYIDFAYKGVPKNTPFEKFVVREKPGQALSNFKKTPSVDEDISEEDLENATEPASMESTDDGEMVINTPDNAVPDENIRNVLHEMYNDSNNIIFGEILDDIVQNVEIPEHQRRYGLEIQTNDLLDELLSTIPDSKRTDKVRKDISVLINRFKELRNNFSKFDDNDNVTGYVYNGPLHKPLIEKLTKINKNVKWIIPVVKQRSNVYVDQVNDEDDDNDVTMLDQKEIMSRENEINKSYKNNDITSINKYFKLYSELDKYNRNFNATNDDTALTNEVTVQTEFDAVINNLEDFYSTVVKADGNRTKLQQRRFVIQRYNMGLEKQDSLLMKSGKTLFIRNNLTPNDEITIKSLLIMPKQCVEHSKVNLPSTNIMMKSQYSQMCVSMFRLLKNNTKVNTEVISNLENELEIDENKSLNEITAYSLDAKYNNDTDRYAKLLQSIIPQTRALIKEIRNRVKNRLTIHSFTEELKPYMIDKKDLAYQQQNELRYTIKLAIEDFNKNFIDRSATMNKLHNLVNTEEEQVSRIERMLFNNTELLDLFKDGYKVLDTELKLRNSELLNKLLLDDNLTMLSDIITSMNIKTLTTPEQLLNSFQPGDIEDEGENAKIKPTDCTRRYLTKKYNTVTELQADNTSEQIYYDDEYDDTPYDILDLYTKEKKEMEPSLFKEFLQENLIQKHDVKQNYSVVLSEILIAGKKPVTDGEYAILELKPGFGKDIDETLLTPKERKAIEIESETRKKQGYYKRLNNQWIFDKSINPETFIDTNTLFCNIKDNCNKNPTNSVCEPNSFSRKRVEQLNKARMVKEFENRIDISLEQLDEKIKRDLINDFKILRKMKLFAETREQKYNNLAYEIGKTSSTIEVIRSPREVLRDSIMGLSDFTKKQSCIIKFVDEYCREPLVDMKEDMNWLYCKDSNTPIMPISIEKLAQEFTLKPSNYTNKLDEICALYGTLNDDNDAIVDKYSGYTLRKIDFVMQETYNENGFIIQTHDVLEKDLATQINDVLTKQVKPVHENELNEMIYNVAHTLSTSLGIKFDGIQEGVLRLSSELVDASVYNEIKYEEINQKKMKKTGKKSINYETYKNRSILWIIAASLLVHIQTSIPGHRSKKTFPGCTKSFSGYPLNAGVEDQSGLEYISCVMYKLKSTIKPWDSISKLKRELYTPKIRDVIDKHILNARPDIAELYNKKQKYILENPDIFIPEEHSTEKWKHFMPPIISSNLSRVQPLSRDFERSFLDTVRKGHKDQLKHINTMQSKSSLFGFSIINNINAIVNTEEPLLRTNSDIPFLENGCCTSNDEKVIDYFINKDPIIEQTRVASKSLSDLLDETKNYSKASTLYHNEFTGIKRIIVKEQITEEHVYEYIIKHCNFANDLPIPDEYKIISGEKPEDFPIEGSLNDKIDFLKKNGKKYGVADLNNLAKIIRKKYTTSVENVNYFTQVDTMFDILDYLEANDSKCIEENFRRHLRAVLKTYKPNDMISEIRPELKTFNNYLYNSNKTMFNEIITFIKEYGNVTQSKFSTIQDIILSVYSSENNTNDDILNNISNVENAIYYLTKVYPEIILSGKTYNKICSHWNLSKIHKRDLDKVIEQHWNGLLQFHGDKTLIKTMRNIGDNTCDIFKVLTHMPKHLSIFKDIMIDGKNKYEEFYSIFNSDTMGYLHGFLFLSVLYEYVSCANDTEMLNSDIELKKSKARSEIESNKDISSQMRAVDMDDDRDALMEVDITTTDTVELKKRVASVLVLFIETQEKQRKSSMKYRDISNKIHKSKVKEKQKIVTQDLGKLDNDVRRVENLLKKYKMGRWNIGLQKGLRQYDKDTYDRERSEMDDDNLIADGVEELDAIEEQENDEQYDEEANDLRNLGEDYADGNYYNEIPEDNDFGEM